MNPTWSTVFGALLAGAIGGFMIPARPEIRDVPALTKTAEPAEVSQAAASGTPEQAAKDQKIRAIPLTQPDAKPVRAETKAGQEQQQAGGAQQKAAASCATEQWPYRTPNCLDRTATVEANTTVSTKPTEPKVNAAGSPAKPAPEQKSASAPETPPASASTETSREAQSAPAAKRSASRTENRRPARRSERRMESDLRGRMPPRVYLRGPDGRYYVTPEYGYGPPPPYYAAPAPYYMR